jgi:glycosyltransferase involved in cell wall biosynthesis
LIVTSTAVVPAGALAAFFCRLPHVWWVHEYVDRDHDFTFVFGRHLSTRLIGLASTEVVFNSRAVATHFSAVPDRKKSVMYYGIEVQPGVRVVPPSSGEDLELLLLGRRSRTKGGEEALRAVALLVERGVRVRLRMVGAPSRSFDERLEQLRRDLGLEQAVEFIDHSTRPVVEIDRAHILLMCSRNEAFGRVTVEALKRGRPVIGTNTGGTAELIDHGVNGSLYPPGDIEALAASIERFARDPALLVACSDAALASNDRFKVEDERAQFLELAVRAIS